ncbi:uncharacterized protein LOC128723980 [Anopheles nili]|uniref:uncharacterized protein LOC128723980 n=1 Tax=Anopheles nili TaxID=185578 RepID=UPI00237AC7E6|nr:uncharacterized protein LOC128723980 [Anopheles nili]
MILVAVILACFVQLVVKASPSWTALDPEKTLYIFKRCHEDHLPTDQTRSAYFASWRNWKLEPNNSITHCYVSCVLKMLGLYDEKQQRFKSDTIPAQYDAFKQFTNAKLEEVNKFKQAVSKLNGGTGTCLELYNAYLPVHNEFVNLIRQLYHGRVPSVAKIYAAMPIKQISESYFLYCYKQVWQDDEEEEMRKARAYDLSGSLKLRKAIDCIFRGLRYMSDDGLSTDEVVRDFNLINRGDLEQSVRSVLSQCPGKESYDYYACLLSDRTVGEDFKEAFDFHELRSTDYGYLLIGKTYEGPEKVKEELKQLKTTLITWKYSPEDQKMILVAVILACLLNLEVKALPSWTALDPEKTLYTYKRCYEDHLPVDQSRVVYLRSWNSWKLEPNDAVTHCYASCVLKRLELYDEKQKKFKSGRILTQYDAFKQYTNAKLEEVNKFKQAVSKLNGGTGTCLELYNAYLPVHNEFVNLTRQLYHGTVPGAAKIYAAMPQLKQKGESYFLYCYKQVWRDTQEEEMRKARAYDLSGSLKLRKAIDCIFRGLRYMSDEGLNADEVVRDFKLINRGVLEQSVRSVLRKCPGKNSYDYYACLVSDRKIGEDFKKAFDFHELRSADYAFLLRGKSYEGPEKVKEELKHLNTTVCDS